MQTLFLKESINIQIQCYIWDLTGQRLQSTMGQEAFSKLGNMDILPRMTSCSLLSLIWLQSWMPGLSQA